MPAKGTYGAAKARAKSQSFGKDLKDTAKAAGYAVSGPLLRKAVEKLKDRGRMIEGQTTDSNNR